MVSRVLNNILKDGELQTDSVVKKILTTADMIISLGLLDNAGSVSHDQAMQTVETEYKKYQSAAISAAERDYLETLKKAEKNLKKGRRITEPGSESGTSS